MKLTERQIKNWREVLSAEIGPYAFMMPVEEIEKLAQKYQDIVDKVVIPMTKGGKE